MRFKVTNTRTRREIRPGDTVTDFRGDKATFIAVAAAPEPGKSGKVTVSDDMGRMTYYAQVFSLEITEDGDPFDGDPQNGRGSAW